MTKKIKTLLIANRGEIAVRVMKTAKNMGMRVITLHTQIEKDLPHVFLADLSINMGEGSLLETYLNQDLIVDIAKTENVDAIHPGYGFLSENAEFARRLKKEKIILVGPTPESMELMGDKKASKEKVESIGGPTIPGYHGDNQGLEFLKKEAKKIGYPVLIKASAGGGGKGMRVVEKEIDFLDHLESCKREAKKSFGNDLVLIEKYITSPRHIEVQVLSDSHGNHLHLFERECSIQRRHQKVIEETPSPALSDKKREEVCEAAVNIAKSIDYLGAGTIEFIFDDQNGEDGSFYFLEMNTRLQVEHPITELVTGVDLVEMQLKIAAGEKLPFKQSDLAQSGHAIEARIYSEDPENDFLPTVGTIKKLGSSQKKYIRLDTGYVDGSEVSTHFDPMLAKLIVYGKDRADAILKMDEAFNAYPFAGIVSNRDYLSRLIKSDAFASGVTYTHFIESYASELKQKELSNSSFAALAIVLQSGKAASFDPWSEKVFFRNSYSTISKRIMINGVTKIVKLRVGKIKKVFVGDDCFDIHAHPVSENLWEANVGGEKIEVHCLTSTHFLIAGRLVEGQIGYGDKGSSTLEDHGGARSPMPGKILKVFVKKGDKVIKGMPLLIMEAMKMEHTLKAHEDGEVLNILHVEGDQVDGGVELIEFGDGP